MSKLSRPARCPAAHPDDTTDCDGPADAVHVHRFPLGGHGTTTSGCEKHAARLLASLHGQGRQGRVHPGSAGDGSALRVYYAAQQLQDGGEQ